ncbi:MAG: 50S ribosomal protein L22 [Holosporaceae bacterium]|jgi:large subunit ribosomal protein L22|nr:50S ribosomal protein L22 [Holosporaceae bacterium]
MSKRLRGTSSSISVVAKDRLVLFSPRKVNAVAKMIRGKPVYHALTALKFCKRAVAQDIRKTVLSAISNAENNFGLDVDGLTIKEAYVGKAMALKRFMARARGNGGSIRKTFSHLTVVLCGAEG